MYRVSPSYVARVLTWKLEVYNFCLGVSAMASQFQRNRLIKQELFAYMQDSSKSL